MGYLDAGSPGWVVDFVMIAGGILLIAAIVGTVYALTGRPKSKRDDPLR